MNNLEEEKEINRKINLQAFIKLLMHSIKYPYAKVNGLLLSEKSKKNSSTIEFVDYIPLFHYNHGLTPMLEIALLQISDYCQRNKLEIAGYFQANKSLNDFKLDVFARKIGEKLASEIDFPPSIVMIDDTNLYSSLYEKTDFENVLKVFEFINGKWDPSSINFSFSPEKEVVEKAIQDILLKEKNCLELNDFDCHLHDIKKNFFNKHINDAINNLQITLKDSSKTKLTN